MKLLVLFFLFIILGLVLYVLFRIIRWIFKKRTRAFSVLMILFGLVFAIVINRMFFQKMHFIQSNVYNNLYLIKHLDKDNELVRYAIQKKIKEHLATEQKPKKKLAYTEGNGIYFYEYYKSFPLSLFQDAGTAYFIENEEDLGGFVTEELGMYTQYRLAECYVKFCNSDPDASCVQIDYFEEGEFVKTEKIELKKFN